MSAVAESDGADLSGDEPLLPRPAVRRALKACLQGRRRLCFAIMLGAIAGIGGLAASPLWRVTPHEVTLDLGEPTAFHAAPSFIAELKHGKARVHLIRLAVVVEVPESQKWRLDAHQSAIEDAIKERLRHYDRRDLEGNPGADRLRDEVLAIVNAAIEPAVASAVLFRHLVLD
jgi:flagellar basal body-associated protein FliL